MEIIEGPYYKFYDGSGREAPPIFIGGDRYRKYCLNRVLVVEGNIRADWMAEFVGVQVEAMYRKRTLFQTNNPEIIHPQTSLEEAETIMNSL